MPEASETLVDNFVPLEPIATHGQWKEYQLEGFIDENGDECYLDPENGKKRKVFRGGWIKPIHPGEESPFLKRLRKAYAASLL